ncbi:hypothetical protein SSS_08263 [Sarcoptes scabiei]|nr:hypothetical protein SSS_08263 [Sarcoptes scabiei]
MFPLLDCLLFSIIWHSFLALNFSPNTLIRFSLGKFFFFYLRTDFLYLPPSLTLINVIIDSIIIVIEILHSFFFHYTLNDLSEEINLLNNQNVKISKLCNYRRMKKK